MRKIKPQNPNQRNITIHKKPANGLDLYTVIDLKAMNGAMQNLTKPVSFKLYMYLASNKNNYNFNLSSSDFFQQAGCSKSAYTSAFNELVEKKYLILKPNTKTVYHFYDEAREEDFNIEETKEDEQEREPRKYKIMKMAVLDETEEIM